MFNRKICILMLFLLFILHISFVSAMDYNETDIIEINDNTELSINDNSCKRDYVTGLSDDVLDFDQGDKEGRKIFKISNSKSIVCTVN